MVEGKVEIIVDGQPVFLDYLHDREIPDSVWNRYMKKFGDKYRLMKDEINIWHLRCKFGTVQLYSLLKHQLCFVGDFHSTRHKSGFKAKCSFKHEITQEGDTDIVIMFSEDILDSVAQTLKIYKRKKLSDEQRKVLSDRMKIIQKQRMEEMKKMREDVYGVSNSE